MIACCRRLQLCAGLTKRLKPTDEVVQLPTDSVPGGDFKWVIAGPCLSSACRCALSRLCFSLCREPALPAQLLRACTLAETAAVNQL